MFIILLICDEKHILMYFMSFCQSIQFDHAGDQRRDILQQWLGSLEMGSHLMKFTKHVTQWLRMRGLDNCLQVWRKVVMSCRQWMRGGFWTNNNLLGYQVFYGWRLESLVIDSCSIAQVQKQINWVRLFRVLLVVLNKHKFIHQVSCSLLCHIFILHAHNLIFFSSCMWRAGIEAHRYCSFLSW